MSFKVDLDDWTQVEIDSWTSDKGNEFVTVRQLKKGKDGKYFPQKTKSGGFSALALRIEQWMTVYPRIGDFFRTLNMSESQLARLTQGGEVVEQEMFCNKCADRVDPAQATIYCPDCLSELEAGNSEPERGENEDEF